MSSDDNTATATLARRRSRTTRRWALPAFCCIYLAASIGFYATLRLFSDRYWPATVLLYSPRWVWLLPLLVLLPLATRRRKLWLLPLATGLLVLGPVMDFRLPLHRAAADQAQSIRLLTCNLHRMAVNLPKLEDYIRQTNPDVVAFQDYSGWDDSTLLEGGGWQTYRAGELFIASRYPIRQVRDLHLELVEGEDDREFPRRNGSAVCFDLQTPGGLVHLVNAHLASPHHAFDTLIFRPAHGAFILRANSIRRFNESLMIDQWLRHESGHVVIAGDFNMPIESPIWQRVWSRLDDAFSQAGLGYGYTHYSLLSEIRIDHVVYGPGFQCAACWTGPACGTPHRPLVADLMIR